MSNVICKKCKGHCCKNEEFKLSIPEYLRVRPYLRYETTRYDVGTMNFAEGGGKSCPALGDKGCLIPKKLRPITCRMFPMTIEGRDRNGQTVLMISGRCPHRTRFRLSEKSMNCTLLEVTNWMLQGQLMFNLLRGKDYSNGKDEIDEIIEERGLRL